MNTPDAIQSRAETLRAMAASKRRDAIVEDERGNIILARNLRERAEDYARRAYWQVTP